jgi:hypothetical protein
MKSFRVILLCLLALWSSQTFAVGEQKNSHKNHECFIDSLNAECQNSQIVYVCMGQYAYAYHSTTECTGLNNCKGELKYTDEYNAINTLGRKPCCICWSNVSGNCADDNNLYSSASGGGGGGGYDSEAYAYVALAIVATGAILLANDIYAYPTYSFYKSNDYKSYYSSGYGISFGFRKTFKHSAIEYGGSYMNCNPYANAYESYYDISEQRWGFHLNYAQQLFYNQTPYWLKFYLGATGNYIQDEFGYGGFAGAEMRIIDRLKFDVRYEYSTLTNQVQAGFIYTFQKKYLWDK